MNRQRYQTMRELGRGGMGVVTLVYDGVRDEPVALTQGRTVRQLGSREGILQEDVGLR